MYLIINWLCAQYNFNYIAEIFSLSKVFTVYKIYLKNSLVPVERGLVHEVVLQTLDVSRIFVTCPHYTGGFNWGFHNNNPD